ncbi:MAG: rod shape-determining protein MreD [Chromatiales bacterium]|jgi:rod shape-determining protein MreD|nr:MAG: rod shape-determining protein MreD [Chromatiales bacterium]
MKAPLWPVWLLMLLALAAELLPLPIAVQPLRPAWTTMAVIYWSLMWPGRFGVWSALVVGLFIDVAHGSLLGQHALSLSIVTYLVLKLHLQMRVFPLWQLTLSVIALMFLELFVLLWIDGATGRAEFGPGRWGPVLAASFFWPVMMAGMDRLRERLERRDSSFN